MLAPGRRQPPARRRAWARRLVTELSRRRRPSDDGERVAASIGIAVSVGGRGTAESLLNEADTAMYQAKSLGGGRAEVFDAALGPPGPAAVARAADARSRRSTTPRDRRPLPAASSTSQRAASPASRRWPGSPSATARSCRRPPSSRSPRTAASSSRSAPRCSSWPASEAQPLAPQRTAAREPDRRRQPLAAPVRARRPADGRRGDARARPAWTPSRLHLELTETAIIDLRPDILRQLGQHQGPRRADRPRRLRHRLRLAHPPPPPAADAS